jgi:hypothetical protein
MWIIAVVVAILNSIAIFTSIENLKAVGAVTGELFFVLNRVANAMYGTIAPVAVLAALGVLIELIDQIRWNTRLKE